LKKKLLKIYPKTFCILIIISLCLLLIMPVSAQAIPPSKGDWTIKDNEIVSHDSITLNGNIIIKSGGELQLNYADLKFNSNKDFEYKIHIEDGGELELRYSSINLNSDYKIVIIVEPEGNFRIYNSTVFEFSTIEQDEEESSGSLSEVLGIMLIVIILIILILLFFASYRMKSREEALKKEEKISSKKELIKGIDKRNGKN